MSDFIKVHNPQCGCTNCNENEKYLQIKNHLSEFNTELAKAEARLNLGIPDQWNLKWGNITGFIENQTDLTEYLDNYIDVFKETIWESFDNLKKELLVLINDQLQLVEDTRQIVLGLIGRFEQLEEDIKELFNDLKEEFREELNSKIPYDEWDNLINANNHIGGYHQVNTLNEMNEIPTKLKKVGMLCYVKDDPNKIFTYQWDGKEWIKSKIGAGIEKIDTEADKKDLNPEPGDVIYINDSEELQIFTQDYTWNNLQVFYVGDTEPRNKSVLWVSNTSTDKYIEENTVVQSLNKRMSSIENTLNVLSRLTTEGILVGGSARETIMSSTKAINPNTGEIEEIEPVADYSEFTVPNLSIRCITTGEANAQNLVDGELLWVTDEIVAGSNTAGRLYIYYGGNFIAVGSGNGGGGTGGGSISANDLIKLYFDYLGFKGENGKKYRIKIDNQEDLVVYCAESAELVKDQGTYGQVWISHDLQINSIYCGGDGNEFSYQPCSHNFVELTNNGTEDLKLNGLYLLYKPHSGGKWQYLPLRGEIKAGSTFLIRGAQCAIKTNTTVINVDTYDQEWLLDSGKLISFAQDSPTFYLAYAEEKNDGLYVYGVNDTLVKLDQFSVPYRSTTCYTGYIDSVGINTGADAEGNSPVIIQAGDEFKNLLFIKSFSMDPVQQANKAYASRKSNSLWSYVNLIKEADETLSNPRYYYSNKLIFRPRSSKENKNIFTSRTTFDAFHPNMVNITFGIQATDNGNGATRCFNWVSVGYYDEFLQYRKKGETSWTTIESITESTSSNYSNDPKIAKCYERIRWITTNLTAVTTHKCIIRGLPAGEYEYRVGRYTDDDYISDIMSFTVRTDYQAKSFQFVQTSDQQGFNWAEYQVWKKASLHISKNHPNIHFTLNTGDITQNGNRESEWLDYYDGRQFLRSKEEMYTIGNNDLCGKVIHALGTGSAGTYKINHVNCTFYFCFEIDDNNSTIFKSGATEYLLPSLYSFNYGPYHFVSINSEIAENTYSVYQDTPDTFFSDNYTQMEQWLKKDLETWKEKNNESDCSKCIVYMHEMPFTIITHKTVTGSDGRAGGKINKASGKYDYKWSRLFKQYGIRLVMGGHKHTYSISKPIYDAPENYIKNNKVDPSIDFMGEVSNSASMQPVVQVLQGENMPESNLVRYEIVDKINAPTYVMSQATGYKLVSNQEIPCRGTDNTKWLLFYFSGNENGSADTANAYQYYPTYILYNITESRFNIKSYQITNIYTTPVSSSKAGAFNINNQSILESTSQEILNTASNNIILGYGTKYDETKINDGLNIIL